MDAGDLLFRPLNIGSGSEAELLKKRARLVARAAMHMGVAAVNVGRRDLAAGVPFVQELGRDPGLPWVSTNLRLAGGVYPFPRWRIVDWGGLRVGVVGLLGPTMSQDQLRGIDVQDPSEAFGEVLEKLQGVDAVVCLSNLGLDTERSLAGEVIGAAIVVGGGSNHYLASPPVVADTVILHASDRGRYLGVLDLPRDALRDWRSPRNLQERAVLESRLQTVQSQLSAAEALRREGREDKAVSHRTQEAAAQQADRIRSSLAEFDTAKAVFRHRLIALGPSVGRDSEVHQWVSEFKALERDWRATVSKQGPAAVRTTPPTSPASPTHTGSSVCRRCHAEAYQAWTKTRHARAYASLKNNTRDPECLACHATHLNRGNGGSFEPVVGCEVCHGPGGNHKARGNIARRPAESVCGRCHRGYHPGKTFEFRDAYDQIRCDRGT